MIKKPNRRSFLKFFGIGAVLAPTVAAQVAKAAVGKPGQYTPQIGMNPPEVMIGGAAGWVNINIGDKAGIEGEFIGTEEGLPCHGNVPLGNTALTDSLPLQGNTGMGYLGLRRKKTE